MLDPIEVDQHETGVGLEQVARREVAVADHELLRGRVVAGSSQAIHDEVEARLRQLRGLAGLVSCWTLVLGPLGKPQRRLPREPPKWQARRVAKQQRCEVPSEWVDRIDEIVQGFPRVIDEAAWVGHRWRVQGATIAHVFGGEDGLCRITFRGEPAEVMAFEHLGEPYFRADWGDNIIGMVLDDATDWIELSELLSDSYCLVAPERLSAQVDRPAAG